MWNLKYDTNGHPYETNRLADTENRTVVAKRNRRGVGMEFMVGVSRCNLLYREWII